uniref:Methylglutaconyl-CoA hydratase, mitochondrial n=1 Tax=Anoplophora glabripennis TaxID=217634 RepID=V5G732_ANOGL
MVVPEICRRGLLTLSKLTVKPKPVRQYSEQVTKDLIFKKLKGDDAGVVTIGLKRPQQKNAISMNLLDELVRTVDKICYDNVARVVVIHSLAPGAFCAGADLKERADLTLKEVCNFVTNLRNFTKRIHDLPIPVIAALDGVALGGGLELALACDIRIAATNAKMGLVETKLAIMPGAGGTQFLSRIVGPAIAKELIFTARVLDAKAAQQLGLVNHVVEQNEIGNAAYLRSVELAEEILPNGPLGIRMAKKAINRGIEVDLDSGLVVEEACYAQLIPTKDRTEGLQAFNEKRKPVYLGY